MLASRNRAKFTFNDNNDDDYRDNVAERITTSSVTLRSHAVQPTSSTKYICVLQTSLDAGGQITKIHIQ